MLAGPGASGSTTRQMMLISGDWVVPRFLDQVRTAKPPFIYWCQATAMRVLGDNAFAARGLEGLGDAVDFEHYFGT